jgi:phosphatidylcholine synthase
VYTLPFGSWVSLAIVVVLAVLTFVPSRYLYPSLPGSFNRATTLLGIPWTVSLVWIIWNLPDGSQTGTHLDPATLRVAWASMSYPVFYLIASWVISLIHRLRRAPTSPEPAE